ncbi:MAG: restriction endonuclease subunit S [Syntrophales bacterium]|nr:restriction endonuclease subunit S [Syntrophales bacterium]
MVEIKSVTEVITKGTTPTSVGYTFMNAGINFVKIEAIREDGHFLEEKFAFINDDCNNKLERSKLQEGDVLFSIAGALGRVAVVTNNILPANTNQALSIIRPIRDKLSSKFLFWMLKSDHTINEIVTLKVGVAQFNLSLKQIGELQFPLPPMEVQEKIVAELDAYQKITDGAKQIVENYKPTIKINPDWPMVELGKIAGINETSEDPVKSYGQNEFVYIDISSIENGSGKVSFSNKLKGVDAPSRAKRKVKKGDILLSTVRPNLQAFGYLEEVPENAIASTGFAVLTPSPDKVIGKYIYFMLFEHIVLDQMIDKMGKGAYPSINQKDVFHLKFPLPPLKTQQKIVAEIEAERELVEANKKLIEIFGKKIKDKIGEVWGE